MLYFRTFAITFLSMVPAISAVADTVTLRSGAKINGVIVRQDRSQVTLSDSKGNLRTFVSEDIAKVELNDAGKKVPPPSTPAIDAGTQAPAKAQPEGAITSQETPKLTAVVAEGVGKDADAATKDALRQAVSQVVGVLVMAEDQVANDRLISSKILTYSNGYVERFEPIGAPITADGMTRIKIKAWVQQGKLSKDLTANAIPVKEVDARSLQGQSDTTADQTRSAEELVVALFTDYPAKLLIAEPLEPNRISGDETATTFEVPVRVRIDDDKWKAWVAEAKKVLDPISTKKGTENWNMRMEGWVAMAGPKYDEPASSQGKTKSGAPSKGPPSKVKQTDQEIRARYLRQIYYVDRFVPAGDRKGAMIAIPPQGYDDYYFPKIAAASSMKRVIMVLDSLGGKLSWWQLDDEVWARVHSNISAAKLDIRLLDTGDDSLAPPLTSWTETEEESRPGRSDRVVIGPDDKLGTAVLSVGQPDCRRFFLDWSCAVKVFEGRFGLRGLHQAPRSGDFATLLFPGASLECEQPVVVGGARFAACPSTIFPFRFQVPRELIPANGKMRVEAKIRISTAKD
jgi:hypothetical protein